ncbi:MAG: hypothetical protein QX195_01255 [Methylococcaceae bacterium]
MVNSGEAVTVNTKAGATTFTGLEKITVTSTTGVGTATVDTITAAATTDVTVTDTATGAAAAGVTVEGGKNILVTEAGTTTTASTVKVGGSSTTNPAGTVTINVTGTGNTKVLADGGTTVNVTSSQTGTVGVGTLSTPSGAVTITSTGAASALTVGGSALLATGTVNVNANGSGNNIVVWGGTTDTIVQGPVSGKQAGVLGTVDVNGAATSVISITDTGTSIGATSAITVSKGAATTIISTGGNIAIANANATDVVTGTINITNTNTVAGDTIKIANGSTGIASGAVNITTTATSGTGAILVGNSTLAGDPTGAVAIFNATVAGTKTYYGNASSSVVSVNGAPSVSITGGGTAAINDYATTQRLATVTLTGVKGAVTIGAGSSASALTTLNINNSVIASTAIGGPGQAATLGGAAVATSVTVTGTTVPAGGRTLAVNLSGNTNSVTVTDNFASTINVVASGTTANKITVVNAYANATNGQNYSFTNNGTGKLTVTAITDTSALGTVSITTAGTGAIVLPDLGALSVKPSSFTTTNTAGVTVKLDGQLTSFAGGTTGNNVVTVDSATTAGIKAINGGTGGLNTLILTNAAANYVAANPFGSTFTNFQTFKLAAGTNGVYDITGSSYTTIATNAAGATSGVKFTGVTAGTALTAEAASLGTLTTILTATGTVIAGDSVTVTVNGVAATAVTGLTAVGTVASGIVTAVNALGLAGVFASASLGVVTITGLQAQTVSYSVTNASTSGLTITPSGTGSGGTAAGGTGAVTTSGAATFANVVQETLSAATGTNTLPLTIGTATTATAQTLSLIEANHTTITVNSLGGSVATATAVANSITNTVNISDVTTTAQANSATSIVVGAGSATNTLALTYLETGSSTINALALVDASGSASLVNTTGVYGSISGITIKGGSSLLTAVGSGGLTSTVDSSTTTAKAVVNGAALSSYTTANDIFTTGTGGGTITIGFAGAGNTTGTTTINLLSSVAKLDTIKVQASTALGSAGAFITTGDRATVNNFTVSNSATTSDVISFGNGTQVVVTNISVASSAAVPVGTGTYSISNGVITLSTTDSTTQQLITARAIVEGQGANHVGAVKIGADTFVISSGSVIGSSNGTNVYDAVIKLASTTGVTGFGNTTATGGPGAATGIIEISSLLTLASATTADTSSGTSGAQTTGSSDVTGFSVQALSGAATGTHTYTNLASAGIINNTATSGTGNYSIDSSQAGTAGQNSILLNIATAGGAASTITSASFTGASTITIADTVAGNVITAITTLIDPNNTATKINILGGSSSHPILNIGTITDTALTTLNISPVTGDLTVGIGAAAGSTVATILAGAVGYSALSQVGLNVTLGANVAATSVINLSGAGDIITATATTTAITIYDTAANVTVHGGMGANTIVVGANAVVDFGTNANTAINLITVGANSSVTLGYTIATGVSTDGGSTITVAGNTAGTAFTNQVNLSAAIDHATAGTKLDFFTATGGTHTAIAGTTGINVGAATSLLGAENIAVQALGAATVGTNLYGWFQYSGETYVVNHTSTSATVAATTLSSVDMVVHLTGLVDLANFAVSTDVIIL